MAIDQHPYEEDPTDIGEALNEFVEADQAETHRRGQVSIWHTTQKYPNRKKCKAMSECCACSECAKSLREQGVADIREIVSSPDDFPDCFAELDGKRIGMEATELIDAQDGQREWSLDTFEKELVCRIAKKDKLAAIPDRADRLACLERLFLVIYTDEFYLTRAVLEEFIKRIRAPRPTHFHRTFVLGPYEAHDNAVRQDLSDMPIEAKARYRAFEVQWR